jgi:magnesium-transporting ATPase (P-type)
MKTVLIAGVALLASDLILLVVWLVLGIDVSVRDSMTSGVRYLQTHVIAALHFTSTIGICLALEAFRDVRSSHDQFSEPYGHSTGYLLSWTIAFLVAFGTDLYSLIGMALEGAVRDVAWREELALAAWAMVDIVLTILWSVWLYAKSKKYTKRSTL